MEGKKQVKDRLQVGSSIVQNDTLDSKLLWEGRKSPCLPPFRLGWGGQTPIATGVHCGLTSLYLHYAVLSPKCKQHTRGVTAGLFKQRSQDRTASGTQNKRFQELIAEVIARIRSFIPSLVLSE
jgi:hypothetical protein